MFAEVIVDIQNSNLDRVFDYSAPSELEIKTGSRVLVPFANRVIEGFVINLKETTEIEPDKIKPILKVLDKEPPVLPEMMQLLEFMCKKYHLKKVSVLKLFIPPQMRGGKVKEKIVKIITLAPEVNIEEEIINLRKTAIKQKQLMEFFLDNNEAEAAFLNDKFSPGAVKHFINKGILLEKNIKVNRTPQSGKFENEKHILTNMQKKAVCSIENNVFRTYLLHGVTGSGKTEVYLNLISKVLSEKKNAVMLVPEISLTPRVFSVFRSRFGDNVAIIHSMLSAGERFDEWQRIRSGEAKVVIGARSAIFAPVQNIGLIIIDEEHEQSYISESDPRYDTYEVAKFRAEFNNCPLVLGSATPSIDSYRKAKEGEFFLLELPDRINGKNLPKIQIVDMLEQIRVGNNSIFSFEMQAALRECAAEKKQAMIFLNRRGYTSFVMCLDCGYIAKCSDCDVSLVYHKSENTLKCHYCGKRFNMISCCQECKSRKLKYGAVGTQQVAAKLSEMFPEVKILRMDNDSTSKKDSHHKILEEFAGTCPAFLVGTQMIAKGHDFKDVTFVGIIDADQGLFQSDYRSSERTFNLITQVSGRAGRAETEGKVILQTYMPKHFVFRYAANYDYKGFFEKESNLRKVTNFPPYTRIIRLLFSCENENLLRDFLKICYDNVKLLKEKYKNDFVYLDVMKSPVKRIKTKFRYQILLRIRKENEEKITQEIYEICDRNQNKNISCFVEINPQNLS